MKKHNYFQEGFLILIGLLIFSAAGVYGEEESITLTTYYPSPYGVYNEMRLYPHPTPTVDCVPANEGQAEGTLFYDSDQNQLMVCGGDPLDWQDISGYWRLAGSNLFPRNNSWNVGIGTDTPGTNKLDVAGAVHLRGSSGGPGLYVSSIGNVGIGTTSPDVDERLDVSGTIHSSGWMKSGILTSANNALRIWDTSGDGGFIAGLSENRAISIGATNTGYIGLGILQGENPYGSFYYSPAPGNNIILQAYGNRPLILNTVTGNIQLKKQGAGWPSGVVFNTATGNLGIGTDMDDPAQRLDVDGQVRIRGGNPGAGKVLTSDSDGVASWQDSIDFSPGLNGSDTDINPTDSRLWAYPAGINRRRPSPRAAILNFTNKNASCNDTVIELFVYGGGPSLGYVLGRVQSGSLDIKGDFAIVPLVDYRYEYRKIRGDSCNISVRTIGFIY